MRPSSRAIRAALCAILPCLFVTAAQAFSDEAVADAEALLKTTTQRAAAKEASAQDVAAARYHLLEMKLASGKLLPGAFCHQAHAELQAMAAAEGDEETKAGLAERREKIDAMTSSPELCQQATELVDSFLFGIAPPAKSADDVKAAEDAAAEAAKRYKAGDLDRLSATLARAEALEAPFKAGKITREAYCGSAQGAVLADLAGWTQQLATYGQIGLLGQIAAKRRLWQFRALCQVKR